MKKDVFDQLEAHFKKTKKWKSLNKAYVNFTHWALVCGDHDSVPYQKNGFYVSWLRHNAYLCQTNFPSIDLVISMAFRNRFPDKDIVSPECMSYIIISVKNCDGTEGYDMEFLPKEAVEGVATKKCEEQSKKCKCNDEAKAEDNNKDETESKYTHCDKGLNIRLTLHALKFINPDSVTSATDNDEYWVKPSEDMPYIAFAMSMGQTEREENLFVGEKDCKLLHISFLIVRLWRIRIVLPLP